MISFVDIESAHRSPTLAEVEARGFEAQESANLELYRSALHLESLGQLDQAREAYGQLLEQPLIADAHVHRALPTDPSLQLRFLALKNLSALEARAGAERAGAPASAVEAALRHALDALKIDDTDGLLWLRLARLARSMGRVSLARHALEQSVRMSPHNQLAGFELESLLMELDHSTAIQGRRGRASWARRPCTSDTTPCHAPTATEPPMEMSSDGHGAISLVDPLSAAPPPLTLLLARPTWSCLASVLLKLLRIQLADASGVCQQECEGAFLGPLGNGGSAASSMGANAQSMRRSSATGENAGFSRRRTLDAIKNRPLLGQRIGFTFQPATSASDEEALQESHSALVLSEAAGAIREAHHHGVRVVEGEPSLNGENEVFMAMTAEQGKSVGERRTSSDLLDRCGESSATACGLAGPIASPRAEPGSCEGTARDSPTPDNSATASEPPGEESTQPGNDAEGSSLSPCPGAARGGPGSTTPPAASKSLPRQPVEACVSLNAESERLVPQASAAALPSEHDAADAGGSTSTGMNTSTTTKKRGAAATGPTRSLPTRKRRALSGAAALRQHGSDAEEETISRLATVEQLLERFVAYGAHCPLVGVAGRQIMPHASNRQSFPARRPCTSSRRASPTPLTSVAASLKSKQPSADSERVSAGNAAPVADHVEDPRGFEEQAVRAWLGLPRVRWNCGVVDLIDALLSHILHASDDCVVQPSNVHASDDGSPSCTPSAAGAIASAPLRSPAEGTECFEDMVCEGTPMPLRVHACLRGLPSLERQRLRRIVLQLHASVHGWLDSAVALSPQRIVSLAEIAVAAASHDHSSVTSAPNKSESGAITPSTLGDDAMRIVRDARALLVVHMRGISEGSSTRGHSVERRLWARLLWAETKYAEARGNIHDAIAHLSSCAHMLASSNWASTSANGDSDNGAVCETPAALTFTAHPLAMHSTDSGIVTLSHVEDALQHHLHERQLFEARAAVAGLELHSESSGEGEWPPRVLHADGSRLGVREACEAAWDQIVGVAEAQVGQGAVPKCAAEPLSLSLQLLLTCWFGLVQEGLSCGPVGTTGASERLLARVGGDHPINSEECCHEGAPHESTGSTQLELLRSRFTRVFDCLHTLLVACLSWFNGPAALASMGVDGAKHSRAASSSVASVTDGSDATALIGMGETPGPGYYPSEAMETGPEAGAGAEERAVDAMWKTVQALLRSLLQVIDSYIVFNASHRGALCAPPTETEATPPTDVSASSAVWPITTLESQRVLVSLASHALPQAARAKSHDMMRGSRRALHLSLIALCKLWLANTSTPAKLAEGLVILQRCWETLNRDQVQATPLPVHLPGGTATRGKAAKHQRYESPFAKMCASRLLSWLRWPGALLDEAQLPEEVWDLPSADDSQNAHNSMVYSRIGVRIAETAALMRHQPRASEMNRVSSMEGDGMELEGEALAEAEALAETLSDAFRKAQQDAVELEDVAIPGTDRWLLRWRPRRGGGGKGDACLTAPDGTKVWSMRAVRRFLRIEPAVASSAYERSNHNSAGQRTSDRSMRRRVPRAATTTSAKVQPCVVDVPARQGSSLDENIGSAARDLLDACIDHLFGKEWLRTEASAGTLTCNKPPGMDHKGCISLDDASPSETELLMQYLMLQCPEGAIEGRLLGDGIIKSQLERGRRRRLRNLIRRLLPEELAPDEGKGRWSALLLDDSWSTLSTASSHNAHPLAGISALLPPPLSSSDDALATSAAANNPTNGSWVLGAHLCSVLASLEASLGESDFVAEVVEKALQRPDHGTIPGAACKAATRWMKFIHWCNSLRAQAFRLSLQREVSSQNRPLPPGLAAVSSARQALSIAAYARKLWGLKVDATFNFASAANEENRAAGAPAAMAARKAADMCFGCLTALLSAPREMQSSLPDSLVDASVRAEAKLELGTLLAAEATVLRWAAASPKSVIASDERSAPVCADGSENHDASGSAPRGLALEFLRSNHHASCEDALRAVMLLFSGQLGGCDDSFVAGGDSLVGNSVPTRSAKTESMDVNDTKSSSDATIDPSVIFASHLLLGCAQRDSKAVDPKTWLRELCLATSLATSQHDNCESRALTELGIGLLQEIETRVGDYPALNELSLAMDASGVSELILPSSKDSQEESPPQTIRSDCHDHGAGGCSVSSAKDLSPCGSDGRRCIAACEQTLIRALQKNPWQDRARLALARLSWRVRAEMQPALDQLQDLITMGRGKYGAFFNMYQAPGKPGTPVYDGSRLGRMRRTFELYDDCAAAAKLYVDVHARRILVSADPSIELERLRMLCLLLRDERMETEYALASRAYVTSIHDVLLRAQAEDEASKVGSTADAVHVVEDAHAQDLGSSKPIAFESISERQVVHPALYSETTREKLARAVFRLYEDAELAPMLQPLGLPSPLTLLRRAVGAWRATITMPSTVDAADGGTITSESYGATDVPPEDGAPPPRSIPISHASDGILVDFCQRSFPRLQPPKRLKPNARGGSTSVAGGQKRNRCGECAACPNGNSDVCKFCLDMPQFGGQASLRQDCVSHACEMVQSEERESKRGKPEEAAFADAAPEPAAELPTSLSPACAPLHEQSRLSDDNVQPGVANTLAQAGKGTSGPTSLPERPHVVMTHMLPVAIAVPVVQATCVPAIASTAAMASTERVAQHVIPSEMAHPSQPSALSPSSGVYAIDDVD